MKYFAPLIKQENQEEPKTSEAVEIEHNDDETITIPSIDPIEIGDYE